MRRATLIVAVAVLLLSFVPFVPTSTARVLLLTLAALAMTAAAYRDYGRVAASATLVAFTSSAVVLLGGLTAARPAAGSLPTAGVFWWWPLAVGGLLTARLSFELHSHARDASRWLAAFMLLTFAAWGLHGQAAEVARVLTLAPLSALVGLAIAAFTDPRVGSTWRGPAFLASLAATAGWQAWVVRGIAIEPRIVVPLVVTSTLVLFVDALSDDDVAARSKAARSAAAALVALGTLGLVPGIHAVLDALTPAHLPARAVIEARRHTLQPRTATPALFRHSTGRTPTAPAPGARRPASRGA
jgi:hypothetical protein